MSNSESETRAAFSRLQQYIEQRIVGQQALVQRLMMALLCDGHLLLEGAPGLAKTRAIKTLANGLEGDFHRIQFTPDLLPADLTGSDVYRPEDGSFHFSKGPLFHNLILADEVNRAPAKVQSALLEAMEERQVTVGSTSYPLSSLFLVLATQNPIEQEGTYPLPEAQLDRFMLSINIGYPTRNEEREIVMSTTQTVPREVRPVLHGQDILWIQQLVRQVPASRHMVDYAVDLARATRPKEPPSPEFIKNWLAWGAGPRAAQYMILGAKARAILQGRFAVSADDIRAMAYPVLRHRLFTNFNADAEGIDVDQVIEKILQTVPEPTYGESVPTHGEAVPTHGESVPASPSQPGHAPPPSPDPVAPPRVVPPPPPPGR